MRDALALCHARARLSQVAAGKCVRVDKLPPPQPGVNQGVGYGICRSMSAASASNWFAMCRRRSARCGSITPIRRSWAAAIRSNAAACRNVCRRAGSDITSVTCPNTGRSSPTYVGKHPVFSTPGSPSRSVHNSLLDRCDNDALDLGRDLLSVALAVLTAPERVINRSQQIGHAEGF